MDAPGRWRSSGKAGVRCTTLVVHSSSKREVWPWGCHCQPCFYSCLPMKRLQSLVFCSSHDGPTYLSVFYNPRGRSRFCLLRAEATIRVLPPGFTVQGRDTGFECGDFPIFYHLKHFETNCLQHSDQSIKSNLFQILLGIEFWSWIKYF